MSFSLVFLLVVTAAKGPAPSLACWPSTKRVERSYPDGSLEEWCKESDGMRTGPFQAKYSNGKLLSEGKYSSGRKDGLWRYFWNNGVKWREEEWGFGELKSSWVNPIVYTLSREELAALGAVSDAAPVPKAKVEKKPK